MKKTIIIPSIVAAILLLPGLYFGGIMPLESGTIVLSPAFDIDELMKRSERTVEGTLVDDRSYVEWYVSGNIAVPHVYTVWTLETTDSIKGEDTKTVEFVVDGGSYNNIKQTGLHETELNRGDKVIVFLSRGSDGVYGDNYYLTGVESGVYKIENGQARNSFMNTSYNVNSLKTSLQGFS